MGPGDGKHERVQVRARGGSWGVKEIWEDRSGRCGGGRWRDAFVRDGQGEIDTVFLGEQQQLACGQDAVDIARRVLRVIKILARSLQLFVVARHHSDMIHLIRAM